jgi:hypothetical protein
MDFSSNSRVLAVEMAAVSSAKSKGVLISGLPFYRYLDNLANRKQLQK